MADSTRDMRRSVYEREVQTRFGKLQLREISGEDVRSMADAIVARGAPATAIHAREIILMIFRYAIERGQKVSNPAEEVAPSTIATFEPKDRALSKEEIGLFYRGLEKVGTTPSIRAACQTAAADLAAQRRAHQCQMGGCELHRRHAHHSSSKNEGPPPSHRLFGPAGH